MKVTEALDRALEIMDEAQRAGIDVPDGVRAAIEGCGDSYDFLKQGAHLVQSVDKDVDFCSRDYGRTDEPPGLEGPGD